MIFRCANFLVLSAFLLLSGCATLDSSSSGQIAGSIGLQMITTDSHFASFFLRYRSMDKKRRGSIGTGTNMFGGAMSEIKEGSYHGATFLQTLPAGDYAFLKPQSPNLIEALMEPDVEISRFTVRPGKVTYVGAWVANPVRERTFLGVEKTHAYTVSVENRESRDMAYVARKTGKVLTAQSATSGPSRVSPALAPSVRSGGTEYLEPSR